MLKLMIMYPPQLGPAVRIGGILVPVVATTFFFGTPWGTFARVTSQEVRSIVLKYDIERGRDEVPMRGSMVTPVCVHAGFDPPHHQALKMV
jgi:hypothetical protein